jgi:hypothetical protein
MEKEEQLKLADLHDHLRLHTMDDSGRCTGCGIRCVNGEPIRFDPFPPLLELIPDVKYKVEFGSLTEADKVKLKPLAEKEIAHNKDYVPSESFVIYHLSNIDPELVLPRFVKYYDITNRYITANPQFLPFGHKPLSDFPEIRRRLVAKIDEDGYVNCDAYTPKRLGWMRMGQTEDNVTNGNKAVAYQHSDGRIAIYYSQRLTELRLWTRRCRALTLLLIKLFGTKEVVKQSAGVYHTFVERYAATGIFEA